MFFLLSQSKRSLSIELHEYFASLGQIGCTKGAFSKARYRISWLLFRDWNEHLVRMIYTASHGLRTWKGFYLKAVDGSSIYLFKDDAVEATFGYHKNQHQTFSMPMARIGLELDVLNGYCTQAQIQSCREAEGVFADVFLSNATSSDLHIYDRCFANFSLIFKHLHKKSHFLIRCSLGFNVVVQAFVKSGSKDAVVTFPCTKNAFNTLIQQGFELTPKASVSVRLVRLDIGSDEPEILITNLFDQQLYPHNCFKKLYNFRWGIESRFDQIKNKLQLEIFSGHKPQAIYQDFFATIIVSNLHNLFCEACDKKVRQINKKRKTHVKINHNVSLGLLKPLLGEVLNLTIKLKKVITEITQLFLRYLELKRPGRLFPRVHITRRLKGKHQTFKNYRRAC